MFYAILIILTITFIIFRITRSMYLREQRQKNLERVIKEFNEKFFNESE